jgi:hypothetical protein
MLLLTIDVIAFLPEELGLCRTCTAFLDQVTLRHASGALSQDSYPPEYQQVVDRLAELVKHISIEFSEKVLIRLVDPRSLTGIIKVIRHGIRHYPTVLIQGKEKITVLEWEPIKQAIQSARRQAETA